jgi:nitrogen fixation protein FixH
MMLAMGLVVAVNVRFIYIAVATFPGVASQDDFDTSNRYDRILRAVAAQNAIGWAVQAQAEGARPVLDLGGPDRLALTGASVTATALRPLGPDLSTRLNFRESPAGHYVAIETLPRPGQWDLQLAIARAGHMVRVTRRIVVK